MFYSWWFRLKLFLSELKEMKDEFNDGKRKRYKIILTPSYRGGGQEITSFSRQWECSARLRCYKTFIVETYNFVVLVHLGQML